MSHSNLILNRNGENISLVRIENMWLFTPHITSNILKRVGITLVIPTERHKIIDVIESVKDDLLDFEYKLLLICNGASWSSDDNLKVFKLFDQYNLAYDDQYLSQYVDDIKKVLYNNKDKGHLYFTNSYFIYRESKINVNIEF